MPSTLGPAAARCNLRSRSAWPDIPMSGPRPVQPSVAHRLVSNKETGKHVSRPRDRNLNRDPFLAPWPDRDHEHDYEKWFGPCSWGPRPRFCARPLFGGFQKNALSAMEVGPDLRAGRSCAHLFGPLGDRALPRPFCLPTGTLWARSTPGVPPSYRQLFLACP